MANYPDKHINSFSLIEKVVERLDARRDLRKLAGHVVGKISEEGKEPHLNEEELRTFCFSKSGSGYQSTEAFSCASNFECLAHQPFKCNGGNRYTQSCEVSNVYNNCGGKADAFECNNDTPFLCNKTTLFDCPTFTCGVPQKVAKESFTCNSEGDFNCAGQTSCMDDFQCTAGHIHLCVYEFTCKDEYECAGGKVCDTNPKAIYFCSETPGLPQYMDNGDELPGDFQCGQNKDMPTNFACEKTFNCVSKSDFMCEKAANFKCMKFTCNSGAEIMSYACRESFECKSTPPYQCKKNNNSFACTEGSSKSYNCDVRASYSLCPTVSEKELLFFLH